MESPAFSRADFNLLPTPSVATGASFLLPSLSSGSIDPPGMPGFNAAPSNYAKLPVIYPSSRHDSLMSTQGLLSQASSVRFTDSFTRSRDRYTVFAGQIDIGKE